MSLDTLPSPKRELGDQISWLGITHSGYGYRTQTGSLMTTATSTQLPTRTEAGERTFLKIRDLMEDGHSQVLTREQLHNILMMASFDLHRRDRNSGEHPEGAYTFICDYE